MARTSKFGLRGRRGDRAPTKHLCFERFRRSATPAPGWLARSRKPGLRGSSPAVIGRCTTDPTLFRILVISPVPSPGGRGPRLASRAAPYAAGRQRPGVFAAVAARRQQYPARGARPRSLLALRCFDPQGRVRRWVAQERAPKAALSWLQGFTAPFTLARPHQRCHFLPCTDDLRNGRTKPNRTDRTRGNRQTTRYQIAGSQILSRRTNALQRWHAAVRNFLALMVAGCSWPICAS